MQNSHVASHLQKAVVVATLLIGIAATATLAQQAGIAAPSPNKTGAKAPSTKEYLAANDKMHKDMAISYSGSADVDFVRAMIPHHQGAIDMAKVVIAHGKDKEIAKLAAEVIKAQETEIAQMRVWLQKNVK